MASSTLGAGLSHFFCFSWLPCPPCTLGAKGRCLPLPAAGVVRAAGVRAEPRSLKGPSNLWPWMGAAHPAGWDCWKQSRSGWMEGADLALQVQALRCLARGSAHTLVVVWVLRVTLTLLLQYCSPPVALSLWVSPGATSMRWTCGCLCWLPQHMVQGSPCPGWKFWCFVPTTLVTLERCLPGPKLENHHLRLLTIPLSL